MIKLSVLFALCVSAFGTTLTGTLPSPLTGNATGTLTLALSQPAQVSNNCQGSLPGGGLYRIAMSSGTPANTTVVGNDCLIPGNTVYVATLVDTAGNSFVSNWRITGSTFNLSNQVFGLSSVLNQTQSGNVFLQMPPGTSFYVNSLTCASGCSGGGTVSVIAGPSWLTWTLVTGTYTATPTGAQTPHQVIGTCGVATTFVPCSLVDADIPSTMTGKTINGVTPTTFGFLDFTSSGQTQINSKLTATTGAFFSLFGGPCTGTNYPGADGNCHAAAGSTANQNIRRIAFHFDGQGSALAGTLVGCQLIPYSGSITSWSVYTDAAGSGTLGVRSVATGSYTGVAGYGGYTDVVNGGTPPTITTAAYNSGSTLTSWVTSITASQMWCMQLSSPATAKWLDAVLIVTAN